MVTNINKDNLNSLTDDQIFKALKDCGLKAGPITGTTRFLYEKRLKTYLTNNPRAIQTIHPGNTILADTINISSSSPPVINNNPNTYPDISQHDAVMSTELKDDSNTRMIKVNASAVVSSNMMNENGEEIKIQSITMNFEKPTTPEIIEEQKLDRGRAKDHSQERRRRDQSLEQRLRDQSEERRRRDEEKRRQIQEQIQEQKRRDHSLEQRQRNEELCSSRTINSRLIQDYQASNLVREADDYTKSRQPPIESNMFKNVSRRTDNSPKRSILTPPVNREFSAQRPAQNNGYDRYNMPRHEPVFKSPQQLGRSNNSNYSNEYDSSPSQLEARSRKIVEQTLPQESINNRASYTVQDKLSHRLLAPQSDYRTKAVPTPTYIRSRNPLHSVYNESPPEQTMPARRSMNNYESYAEPGLFQNKLIQIGAALILTLIVIVVFNYIWNTSPPSTMDILN